MRVLWIGLAVLVLVPVAYITYMLTVGNAGVIEDLRENPQGERAQRAMLLTLADGTIYPVNYLREGDVVFMGVDGRWWRGFRGEGAPVTLLIQGETLTGRAQVVLDDPAYTADVFSRLRPTAPAWLPDWLNGKLVVIRLDAP